MTHKDIYEKFMIEYDKDNVTSSYPSLTRKEQATILDKAYLALIALKFTGNNSRRASFEYDVKSVSDLQGLVCRNNIQFNDDYDINEMTAYLTDLRDKFLYFVDLYLDYNVSGSPMDGSKYKPLRCKLVSHDIANKFKTSATNLPWVKEPVCYIEEDILFVVYDPIRDFNKLGRGVLTYIKVPNKFVGDTDNTEFELNDTMAEELISLAVTFALENVESQRLNTKLNTRGLEA